MLKRFIPAAIVSTLLLCAAGPVDDAKAKAQSGKYDEAVTILEGALKAKPADAAVKKALGETHLAQGNALMFDKALPPFKKYPAALRSFRKVLDYDKANAQAKQNIDMIEGIYKQMGREVPK